MTATMLAMWAMWAMWADGDEAQAPSMFRDSLFADTAPAPVGP